MSPEMKNTEAPALFIKDGDDLNLVNYRVKGDYDVVDRLFDVAELYSGKDEKVIVKKDKPWGWFPDTNTMEIKNKSLFQNKVMSPYH